MPQQPVAFGPSGSMPIFSILHMRTRGPADVRRRFYFLSQGPTFSRIVQNEFGHSNPLT